MTDQGPNTPFLRVLHDGFARGGFQTDDALGILLPLFREVAAAHERGLVAPLRGTEAITVTETGALSIDPSLYAPPQRNFAKIEQVSGAHSRGVEVVAESRRTSEIGEGRQSSASLDIGNPGEAITKPVFLPGYCSWEHALDHHDPVTDIFSLGMLLASLTCGLNFTNRDDVELFVTNRENLFALNSRLHPMLANVVVQMTELNRHRRAQDLRQLLHWLENYRDQPSGLDLSKIKADGASDRRKLIQTHLRDRLFEVSRRNRLIYFKGNLQTLNLTVASVPLVMDVRNIRLEQLFVWHSELAAAIASGEALSLGKYLRTEDAPYIPGVLDKIIAEARRDRAEYGFAQLRLVLCFLRWHNLKEAPKERVHSPLLLLSVELAKRKGVKDQYILTPTSTEAEVNPALRHHLKALYGITLPESIDLQKTSLDAFHTMLLGQIRASEPAVVLEKIDRPKIELVQAKAKQRLDQWRQRQRVRPTNGAKVPVDYSYDREHYRPLGLQLFLQKVRPKPLPLADMVGAPPKPRLPGFADVANDEPSQPSVIETERQMYALRDGEAGNPYHWAFDLCSLTLGNFHYRKMTLVRDYANLVEENLRSPAFDSAFSLEPKRTDGATVSPLPLADQFPVISCDATQAAAVARARLRESFIIQGPPGTGKSQTITNLIADYVAQGKRVLFVCEKRAALDVVFHRLRQQGLDELCCLIHDSQGDKKAFVLNLKQTYEQWLALAPDEEPELARQTALNAIEQDLDALTRFSQAMTRVPTEAGVTLRQLLHRLVEIRALLPVLSAEEEEAMPHYQFWPSHGSLVQKLQQSLSLIGADLCFAHHPLRWLGREVILSPRPTEQVRLYLDEIEPMLDSLETSLDLSGLPEDLWNSLADVEEMLDFAHLVRPLAQRGLLALLDPDSPSSRSWRKLSDDLASAERDLTAALVNTDNWKDRLSPTDTASALEAARKFRASVLRLFQPAYWRLKKTIRTRYDFSRHAVEPSLCSVLEALQTEHNARRRQTELQDKFTHEYGGNLPVEFARLLADARGSPGVCGASVAAFRRNLLNGTDSSELVGRLFEIHQQFSKFKKTLTSLLGSYEKLDFAALRQVLSGLRRELRTLPDLIPALTELAGAPPVFRHAVTHSPIRLDQFEAAMAKKTLEAVYRTDPALMRFDGRLLQSYLSRLDQYFQTWLKSNAGVIRNHVRRQFRENVQISNLTAAQLGDDQKVFKKNYASGRRELEHEFGKTMRYKSIRDLAAGPSGRVLRDLKPIWLMSPLSVSDTLPLDPDLFDVVIFDEASQVTVEEAVPAIYRARQAIVVGDEMQLPPTSFFSSGRDEDDVLVAEEAGERIEVNLEADSFLAQSARNLPSTLLAWHYRSRYESLINFSNAAFYAGNLLTIPDRQLPPTSARALVIRSPDQAAASTDMLLAQSITFHFVENGIYEQRRNAAEAGHIAGTVRELLRRETKFSIGIAAFSEAQQSEIERALDLLADEDKDFAAKLEAEMNREEDDQFCGLFVRNLENIQGDERDIILLSVCYGYDRDKRMLMNFGPINQRGGEKRLNVIFSRARHHMAVITSIRHGDITNEYNDGANALKNFLCYAERFSMGDAAAARTVLENLNPLNRRSLGSLTARDMVTEQLAGSLRERGHRIETHVGQSRFRCDLAIQDANKPIYVLGILVDTDAHYKNSNLIDRYLTQPAILRAFGWQIHHVLTKDWFEEPQAIIESIERRLRGEKPDNGELPELRPIQPEITPLAAAVSPGAETVAPSNHAPVSIMEEVPAASASAAGQGFRRYLECAEDGSRKFWEISVVGSSCTVRFGRLGTVGQSQQKTCPSDAEAMKTALQLISSKTKKGYVQKP